jgi:negative regulator of flagellin synthesis FlgM
MSIESIKGKQPLPTQSRTQNTRSVSSHTENTRGVSSQDTAASSDIKLTKESLRLQELEAEMGNEPVMDKERVKALREAILGGEYQTNSVKIAEKLISFEDELFKS